MTFWLSVCKWEMKWVCDAVPGEEWNGEKPFINWSSGGAEGGFGGVAGVGCECGTLAIIDKTIKKKKREGGWNTAQMYEITLWDLIARHSRLQPCRFSQCRILYVFKQSLGWRGDALQLKICPAISGSLKWVDIIFICLKKKKRRHKNAALAPPQQRGLFGSCNMAPSRYVQIRCTAETIYRLSPSLLKSICNWESLRCPPYCVASPWLSVGFNEK